MPLVYAQVARAADGTVLADHAAVAGNFRAVVAEVLARVQRGGDDRFTVLVDGYNINVLLAGGYAYSVVAPEVDGRQVPFACAKRIADAWSERFSVQGRDAAPYGMVTSFGPTIARELEFCMANPHEVSRMAAVQSKVDSVKDIMGANVQAALARGDNLDTLNDRSDALRDQAAHFQAAGTKLRRRMCWQSAKGRCCIALAAIVTLIVIVVGACFAAPGKCSGMAPHATAVSAPPPAQPAAMGDAAGPADPAGLGSGVVPVAADTSRAGDAPLPTDAMATVPDVTMPAPDPAATAPLDAGATPDAAAPVLVPTDSAAAPGADSAPAGVIPDTAAAPAAPDTVAAFPADATAGVAPDAAAAGVPAADTPVPGGFATAPDPGAAAAPADMAAAPDAAAVAPAVDAAPAAAQAPGIVDATTAPLPDATAPAAPDTAAVAPGTADGAAALPPADAAAAAPGPAGAAAALPAADAAAPAGAGLAAPAADSALAQPLAGVPAGR